MTDNQIEVGHGTSEYISYLLTLTNSQGEELWEGQIEGKEVTNADGNLALQFEAGGLPRDLVDVLRKLPTYYSRWEVMGKDVTYEPSRLVAENSERSIELCITCGEKHDGHCPSTATVEQHE